MVFVYNHIMIPFRDYLLCESILPTRIEYGTNKDLDNSQWIVEENGLHYTFIKVDLYYYCIGFWENGITIFSTSDFLDCDKISDIDYLDTQFTDDRYQTKKILKLFGYIIWVIIQGALKFDLEFIRFEDANPALGSAYKYIVTNIPLSKKLKEVGFEYTTKEFGYFTYRRIYGKT